MIGVGWKQFFSSELDFVLKYLFELISDGSIVEAYLNKKKRFTEEIVTNVPSNLTDRIIESEFIRADFRKYFDEDAWLCVVTVCEEKINVFVLNYYYFQK